MNIVKGTPLLLAFGVLAALVCGMTAECDTCQPSNSVACHSETVFSLCVDGVATRDHVHCPDQKVCTDSLHVCVSRYKAISNCTRKDVAPPNSGCGVCNTPGWLFACLSESTIAFCFGSHTPDSKAIAQCPPGTVCDLSNTFEFCTTSSQVSPSCALHATETSTTTTATVPTTTAAVPTTTATVPTTTVTIPTTTATVPTTTATVPTTTVTVPTTTVTVPTTTARFDPLTYCESGKIIFADENDVTCTKYFMCYKPNKEWEAIPRTCPHPRVYFNPDMNSCQVTKPARCL